MRKVFLTAILGLVLAAPASASPQELVVAMRDPGCHWFYTGKGSSQRNYALTAVRTGPVALLNLDEATLKIQGPGGSKLARVGATLTLTSKGLYRITMVGQAPDDNHLKLTIK